MTVKGVLWDVGNVIVRWDPRTLYSQIIEDPAELDHFLAEVCPMAWHMEIDAGKPFAAAVAERSTLYPDQAERIALWRTRFTDMISGPIAETESAMADLARRGVSQFGLTNMSAECWPAIRGLSRAFAHLSDTIVSGAEGVVKPDPAIFKIACRRTGLAPADLLFIDDSPANIASAQILGFKTHLFSDPAALRPALEARGLL